MAAVGTQPADWKPEPMSERTTVRCYRSYQDAKRAVDRLRLARIPDDRITVAGRGLKWRAPLTAERAARLGGVSGIVIAAATALLLWSFGALADGFSWLSAVIAGGFAGGGIGLLAGLAYWHVTHNAKGQPETGHVDVDRYDLLVELDDAPKARKLLDG